MENLPSPPPQVSIIMPFKNEERWIVDCLTSIKKQTMADWELIAVDDHSTDTGPQLLSTIASEDLRIKCYVNEGTGIIDALKTGFINAAGQYITRMDADDIMMPNKLNSLLQSCYKSGNGSVAVGLVRYFSDSTLGSGYISYADWLNKHTSKASNFMDIYLECPIPSPCWMMHRSDLELCGAFRSNVYPEDYDLAFRMRNHGLKVIGVNEVIHQWRDHPERASRNSPHYSDNRFTSIKIDQFLSTDRKVNVPLIVWGAGKKGKSITSELIRHEQTFRWITNNTRKTGVEIKGTIIEHPDILHHLDECQVIVGFSTFHDPSSYDELLSNYPQHQFFRFF